MSSAIHTENAARIAELNDAFRRAFCGGRVLVTPGVALDPRKDEVVRAVKEYDFSQADPGDDPYGERDFGVIHLGGDKFYWKIDYFDLALQYLSPDPSDPSRTIRVLTIMLAEEY